MKKLFPVLMAVILAFVLIFPALAIAQGSAVTRLPISTRGSASIYAPPICRLTAGVPVYLITHIDETDKYGRPVRWWLIHPATDTAPVCDGWLKSGALRDVVFSPAGIVR
jgi:hypothetical protein